MSSRKEGGWTATEAKYSGMPGPMSPRYLVDMMHAGREEHPEGRARTRGEEHPGGPARREYHPEGGVGGEEHPDVSMLNRKEHPVGANVCVTRWEEHPDGLLLRDQSLQKSRAKLTRYPPHVPVQVQSWKANGGVETLSKLASPDGGPVSSYFGTYNTLAPVDQVQIDPCIYHIRLMTTGWRGAHLLAIAALDKGMEADMEVAGEVISSGPAMAGDAMRRKAIPLTYAPGKQEAAKTCLSSCTPGTVKGMYHNFVMRLISHIIHPETVVEEEADEEEEILPGHKDDLMRATKKAPRPPHRGGRGNAQWPRNQPDRQHNSSYGNSSSRGSSGEVRMGTQALDCMNLYTCRDLNTLPIPDMWPVELANLQKMTNGTHCTPSHPSPAEIRRRFLGNSWEDEQRPTTLDMELEGPVRVSEGPARASIWDGQGNSSLIASRGGDLSPCKHANVFTGLGVHSRNGQNPTLSSGKCREEGWVTEGHIREIYDTHGDLKETLPCGQNGAPAGREHNNLLTASTNLRGKKGPQLYNLIYCTLILASLALPLVVRHLTNATQYKNTARQKFYIKLLLILLLTGCIPHRPDQDLASTTPSLPIMQGLPLPRNKFTAKLSTYNIGQTHFMYFTKGGGLGIQDLPSGKMQWVRLIVLDRHATVAPVQWDTPSEQKGPNRIHHQTNRTATRTHMGTKPGAHQNETKQLMRPKMPCMGGQGPKRNKRKAAGHLPYQEPQVQKFCQIHALNAYHGYRAYLPTQVMSILHQANERYRTQAGHTLQGYFSQDGNLSNPAVNYYLATAARGTGFLTHHKGRPYQPTDQDTMETVYNALRTRGEVDRYQLGIHPGSSKAQILSLLGQHTRMIIHYTKLPGGYGHAVCLKRHEDQWFLLDSENPSPINLDQTEKGWEQLYGNMYCLTQIPPYLGDLALNNTRQETTHIVDLSTHTQESPPKDNPRARRRLLSPIRITPLQQVEANEPGPPQPTSELQDRTGMAAERPSPLRKKVTAPRTFKQALIGKFFSAHPRPNKPPPPESPPKPTKKQCPATQTPTSTDHTPHTVTVATLNCRGIRTTWNTINLHTQHCTPDFLILTETKLNGSNRMVQAIKRDLPQYTLHKSSHPSQQGQAGVLMLTHKRYALNMTPHHIPPELTGYLAHLEYSDGGHTVHIAGVYVPSDAPHTRTAIYNYLAKLQAPNTTILAGGDWNAAWQYQDRSTRTLTHMDQHHQQACTNINLVPVQLTHRNHTYHQFQAGRLTHSSRIDDFLIYPPPPTTTPTHTDQLGSTLDHQWLQVSLPSTLLPICPCPPAPAPPPRHGYQLLQTPIKKGELDTTREQILTQLDTTFHLHTSHIQLLHDQVMATLDSEDPNQGWENATALYTTDALERMAQSIMAQLQEAMKVMMVTCSKKPPIPGAYTPRVASKQYQKLTTKAKLLKQLRTTGDLPKNGPIPKEVQDLYESLPATLENKDQWYQSLNSSLQDTLSALSAVRLQNIKDKAQASRAKFQRTLATQPKRAHRGIFNKSTHPTSPTALRDEEGRVQNNPQAMLNILTQHMAQLMAPTNKHRNDSHTPPTRIDTPPPWQHGTDGITLARPTRTEVPSLLDLVRDQCRYDRCNKRLSKGKAPGPDGIPNELLICLPPSWHATLHKLFVLMWIKGYTPTCWQESNTVVLYKKGDPMDAANYRPIGLANTVGKLWTGLVSSAMATYAEHANIFTAAQEGFRASKNTHRQLLNLVHAAEDAALTKQDLFVAYYDFQSAFNMVDHDKLLQIMRDLGFPKDAVEVVRGINTGAMTRISLSNQLGEPIYITRGTIQGDTLSPLLFIIFVEPLHRWLQAGGRGYNFGLVPTTEKDRCTMGSMGYADDTTALTHTVKDLQIQCQKVAAFSSWAGIPLSPHKCEVTGILHKTCPAKPTNPQLLQNLLENRISLGGGIAKYVPPTKACKYLGLYITLTLDWTEQVTHTLLTIKERGEQIVTRAKGAGATPGQCLRLIDMCVRPLATYPMTVAPFSKQDIMHLDRAITTLVKRCWNLPLSFPNAAIHLPKEEAGMGVPSLLVDYIQVTAATLTKTLNDTGRLGITSRILLQTQCKICQDMDPSMLRRRETPFLTGARQIWLLHKANVTLQMDGTDITPTTIKLLEPLGHLSDATIPPSLLFPLRNLGITRHTQLLNPQGTHLISTMELNLAHPQATSQHKRCLNRLTLLLTGHSPATTKGGPTRYKPTGPLPLEARKLPRPDKDCPPGLHTIPHLWAHRPAEQTTQGPSPVAPQHPPPPHWVEEAPPEIFPGPWWEYLEGCRWTMDWDKKRHLLPSDFLTRGSFPVYHGWGLHPSAAQIEQALAAPHGPPPALRLILLHYNHQLIITHLTGFRTRAKRDWEEVESHRSWDTHWAPLACLPTHVPACLQLGLEVDHITTTETLHTIHWKPVRMYQHDIQACMGDKFKALLLTGNQPLTAPPAVRRDLHLTAPQQQGLWEPETPFPAGAYRKALQFIKLDPTARNPDLDTTPSGSYTIQVGLRRTTTVSKADTAFVYHPDGRCLGHMPANRARELETEYHTYAQSHPSSMPLPVAIARLLHRYSKVPGPTEAQLHPALLHALTTLGTTQERFASPLDFHPHLMRYSSLHPEDQAFGAANHAYKQAWTGGSIAHPPHTTTEVHKAFRWALASAQAFPNEPTCTILVAPIKGKHAAASFLSHPMVHTLARIPGTPGVYHHPTYWAGEKMPTHPPTETDTICVAICNQPGLTQLLNPNYERFQASWYAALHTALQEGARTATPPQLPPAYQGTGVMVPPPKGLRPLLRPKGRHTLPTPPPRVGRILIDNPQMDWYPHQSLLPKVGLQIYTDGSVLPNTEGPAKVGAAVWVEGGSGWRIDPGGDDCTRTINRAELVAIHEALREHGVHQPLTIYTDSACCVYNLKRMLTDPNSLRDCKHYELLAAVTQRLFDRAQAQTTTAICKVKSHTGIYGNDQADDLAKKAATQGSSRFGEIIDIGQQAHKGRVWPQVRPPPRGMTQPGPKMASNLSSGVRKYIPVSAHLGSANTQSLYYNLWTQTKAALDPEHSHHWWGSSQIRWSTKTNILKLRWGSFWNKKLAHTRRQAWYGAPAHDATCPICHRGEDGAGHILGGCRHPEFQARYISRHNAAVQGIHRAIAKGSRGNMYCVMDAGKASELPRSAQGTRLPPWLKPSSVPSHLWAKMRPDLAYIDPNSDGTYDIDLIEVGYCGDLNHSEKVTEKLQQHANLASLLKTAGHTVHRHTITLGHTGTIPKATFLTLRDMGVSIDCIPKTLTKLNLLAATRVEEIVTRRRQMERELGASHTCPVS